MMTWDMCHRLRQRGLLIWSEKHEYEDEILRAFAQRISDLVEQIDHIDDEITREAMLRQLTTGEGIARQLELENNHDETTV